ncbi:hypothetical protein BGW36DRAFT_31131 [Talaromyces proteolyticus]|uniref:Uncharacterized protein n=1 Tax=Talaromyces proteolyticus TaxID=1131652 RepID=A0AAD4KID6_9EURO|nr:uncharacterized protein BGW36DRAFT_31131 [Talaromyces proteolyticus]KAH8692948.1 hypothetical protein BGW36DRAFT_31131 [Talaromyces proteolyticus]
MAPPKPSLTSQARAAELNAATAARARSMGGELGDFSELPSSQPISLGDITMRNHSRNKGSKSWKPFPQENMPNHLNGPAEALRRPQRPVDRYYPPMVPPATYPHMPPPLHMNPQMPYYGQPAYPAPDFQYPMYQGMYYYQQMYPGQIGYYQPGPAQTPIPAPALANLPVPAPVPALAPAPAPVPTPTTTPVILTNKPAVSNPEFAVDPMKRQETPVNCFVPQDMSPTKQEEDMIRSKFAAYERGNDKPQEKARGQTHASPDDTPAANPSTREHL